MECVPVQKYSAASLIRNKSAAETVTISGYKVEKLLKYAIIIHRWISSSQLDASNQKGVFRMNTYHQFFSAALVLFLVMDPAGNLPIFVALLKNEDSRNVRKIIFRESLFALVILLLFLLCGDMLLGLLQVSQNSLKIAGGIILFLIAIKMIFGSPVIGESHRDGKFLLVPLAVPLIAGPSSIAMVVLMHATAPLWLSAGALFLAWCASTAILITGRKAAEWFGISAMNALESLMGFILAIVSIEMIISGIRIVLNLK